MKHKNLSILLKPISALLRQVHVTIVIVLVVAGLAYTVVLLNEIITSAGTEDESYKSPISAGSIDQATLDRIQQLHTSRENYTKFEPGQSGRLSPFTEQ